MASETISHNVIQNQMQHQSVTLRSLSGFKICEAQVHERAELESFGCQSRGADEHKSELLGGSCWPEVNLDLIKLKI